MLEAEKVPIKHNLFDALTLMSDQERISPHNIHTISSRQVLRIKKNRLADPI